MAIEELTFSVQSGEFACILGSSGCGKSTFLNVLAGFIPPTTGAVRVNGEKIVNPGPDRAMVFQNYSLFPWKTVAGNVEFGLKMAGVPARSRRKEVERYLRLVGLTGFEGRYPGELSGGMEQRVGIARALAVRPSVLLMDEPFGALDAQTRILMQELLLNVWQETNTTVIFVTHDVDEAIFLGDRLFILTARPGRLKTELKVEIARPRSYEVLASEAFMLLKSQVLHLIREEVESADDTARLGEQE